MKVNNILMPYHGEYYMLGIIETAAYCLLNGQFVQCVLSTSHNLTGNNNVENNFQLHFPPSIDIIHPCEGHCV